VENGYSKCYTDLIVKVSYIIILKNMVKIILSMVLAKILFK